MNDITPSAGCGFRRHIHLALLIALFAAEAIVFYAHIARDIAPFYPPRFDQLSYYLSTYDLLGAFHAKGSRAFVDELLQPGNPTGTTFVLQGALLSLIGGANRTTFLSVNLLYFLGLQFVLFAVVRSRIGRIDFAWIGIALLLSSATLIQAAGGIYDYRIDFSAMCLYGIWTCLVVWCGAFRHTGRSLIVALAGILIINLYYWGWRSHEYVLTDQRVILNQGIISKFSRSITIDRIQDLTTFQGLWGPTWGFGDIELESAGREGAEMLSTVPHPQQLRNAIFGQIEARRRQGGSANP